MADVRSSLCCLVHPVEWIGSRNPALRPEGSFHSRGLAKPVPSLHHVVSFRDFAGTMNRSDSRPQLSVTLRLSLARRPHRRPTRWTRSGLLGSDNNPTYVMRSTTPAERYRLAYRRHPYCLRCREPTRPPRTPPFEAYPAPRMSPVYASDPTLPPRLQDSVPACPLRR